MMMMMMMIAPLSELHKSEAIPVWDAQENNTVFKLSRERIQWGPQLEAKSICPQVTSIWVMDNKQSRKIQIIIIYLNHETL